MNRATYIYYLATPLDGIIKQVTRVQTLCEVFNQQQSLKTFLTEAHKLLKMYLTIPVTTASSEHNISGTQTYQNLTQEFYDSATSKPLLKNLLRNEMRIAFFGHFLSTILN